MKDMKNLSQGEQIFMLLHRAEHLLRRGHHPGGNMDCPAQGRVLAIIAKEGTISQRALLERVHVRSASLSELLIKLERNGLVSRERDEIDKRIIIITITEAGIAQVAENRKARTEGIDKLFAELSDDEKAAVIAAMTKLTDKWESERGMAPDQNERFRHHHGPDCEHHHEHHHARAAHMPYYAPHGCCDPHHPHHQHHPHDFGCC